MLVVAVAFMATVPMSTHAVIYTPVYVKDAFVVGGAAGDLLSAAEYADTTANPSFSVDFKIRGSMLAGTEVTTKLYVRHDDGSNFLIDEWTTTETGGYLSISLSAWGFGELERPSTLNFVAWASSTNGGDFSEPYVWQSTANFYPVPVAIDQSTISIIAVDDQLQSMTQETYYIATSVGFSISFTIPSQQSKSAPFSLQVWIAGLLYWPETGYYLTSEQYTVPVQTMPLTDPPPEAVVIRIELWSQEYNTLSATEQTWTTAELAIPPPPPPPTCQITQIKFKNTETNELLRLDEYHAGTGFYVEFTIMSSGTTGKDVVLTVSSD